MPRGDRTGPEGEGAMSGRGAGFCGGFEGPGSASPLPGRGLGRFFGGWGRGFGAHGGGGRGRGWRHQFGAAGPPGRMWGAWFGVPSPEEEADAEKRGLETAARALRTELESVEKRLQELDPEAKGK